MSSDGLPQSFLVDGKNLALSHGTGVASYAYSLCANLKVMNRRVELLYGEHLKPLPARTLPLVIRYPLRHGGRMIQALRTAEPQPLDVAATERLPANQPYADAYWNARDAFDPPSYMVKIGRMQKVRNVMGANVAHWTYPVATRLDNAFNVYTLHDLVPLMLPELTLDDKRAYFAMIRKITETADLIITVSGQSKADIHSLFKVSDDRVINTYQDVNIPQGYLTSGEDELARALEADHGLESGHFILFYGAVEPKKNVRRLVEAFLASRLSMPLVIAGKDGWLVEQELHAYRRHIEASGNAPRIIRIPYVPRRQLFNLIRGACAVAFPSVYEGFGLPIAEAMLCGTPLLTSNFGAMREIAGDAAILVDPYSTDSIRSGLERLSEDAVLRSELRAAGLERSVMFSAQRYRERLRNAYSILK